MQSSVEPLTLSFACRVLRLEGYQMAQEDGRKSRAVLQETVAMAIYSLTNFRRAIQVGIRRTIFIVSVHVGAVLAYVPPRQRCLKMCATP
jgi:hypothetical protein